MDTFVDERDYKLLEQDRYTFFVLRRVLGGSCQLILSDHENLILCYTCAPYPVWIWTRDDASPAVLERAYELASEHGLLRKEQRFNLKYELAAYMIRRAAEDGLGLNLYENMFAYDCPNPVPPSEQADGGLHRCTPDDVEELAGIIEAFANETGLDKKDKAGYLKRARASIEAGRTFFWKTEGGRTAACCKYVPNGDMASVGLVYTFPEHRRKHGAENLVYRVTLLAKGEGLTPMLYTNADYAASNACYRKLGYELRGRLCSVAVT